ncbi:serine protease [Streptomyces sp. NPDC021622]|uniref:S1 family peptidase n=1 Tax=Streptomyces sp. NPDC021622 TaxID=3155013 RepID=UPI0033F0E84D
MRLTKYFALTAAHCLGDDRKARLRPVVVRLACGRRLAGEVKDCDPLTDMALVKIIFGKGEKVPLPGINFDAARRGEPWRAAHRPPGNGVELRGTVSDVSVIYQSTHDDQAVSCHLLRQDGSCGNVKKFVGSPVDREELDPDRPSVVLGLIVARPAATEAPQDTLFAGVIDEAVRRFDSFRFRPEPARPLSESERIYTVLQDPQAEAAARKDHTVREGLKKAGVSSYVNLRWNHRP